MNTNTLPAWSISNDCKQLGATHLVSYQYISISFKRYQQRQQQQKQLQRLFRKPIKANTQKKELLKTMKQKKKT